MKKYTNTFGELDQYLEDIIDEVFFINALINYYQNQPPGYNRLYKAVQELKGEREMLLYPFTDLDIYEYRDIMFRSYPYVKCRIENNTLYTVADEEMAFYLSTKLYMTFTKHDTDTKEFFYVDEYGKEYVIPYIEKDDQILLVITDTYKLENQDETMM